MSSIGIFDHFRIWFMLGMNDVRMRYRRSFLGPFWATISMAVTIAALAFVYSSIFKIDLKVYVPLVGISYIVWGYIATSINEAATVFIESANLIQTSNINFATYIFRTMLRNFVFFLHNLVLVPFIYLIFDQKISLEILLLFPGIIIFMLNIFWISAVVGFISARYRDMPQIINALVQIGFFVSPIMWRRSQISDHLANFLDWNFFAIFLDLMRAPLLSETIESRIWIVSLISGVVGTALTIGLSQKIKSKMPFYL